VCGLPRVINVKGDGRADLVALVYLVQSRQFHLQAVNGQTGKLLWSEPVGAPPPEGERRRAHEYHPEVALGSVQGRSLALCVAGDRLHGLDVRTGRPAWLARPLPWRLLRAAQFADLDGDGSTDALLLHEDEPCRLTLTALDLAHGRTLWEASWPGVPEPLLEEDAVLPRPGEGPDWPLLVDLDGDGRPEVVVRQADFSPRYDLPARSRQGQERRRVLETVGVRVLDGATGRTRWQRALGRSRSENFHRRWPFRLLAGPPRSSGSRDLVVASLVVRWRPGLWHRPELYVDCLSGGDGASRWWWRLPMAAHRGTWSLWSDLGRLVWWQAGAGHDLLVVPLNSHDVSRAGEVVIACVLDAGSGTLRHTVSGLEDPRVADLDGDGVPELLGWVAANLAAQRPRSWRPISGTAPARLREAERFKPGTRFVLRMEGGGSVEQEPEPTLPEQVPQADPRGAVPLPWDRIPYLGGMGETNFFVEVVPRILLVIVPLVLVITPPIAWAEARRKKRLRGQGLSDADIRACGRAWGRWLAVRFGLGLLLTLAAALVCLALDAERRPDERYIWQGWQVPAVMAWLIVSYVLLGLSGLLALVRKAVRRLRRKPA
jgi:hypothetical protein